MLKNKKIAVVVPAFNEEKLIVQTVMSMPIFVDYILVVDDASEDKTIENLKNLDKKGLIVISHENNKGVGASIVTGYKESLMLGANIVAVMAGDSQMDPDELISVLKPVLYQKKDYAKGNRFLDKSLLFSMPKLRIFGNICFSIMSCLASGYYHIFDTQCGFTAIDVNVLKKIDLDSIYPRYGFPTDFLTKLNMISARVVDVKVRAIYNTEKSGIKPLSYTINMICLTLKLFAERQLQKFKRQRVILQDI